jgi:hypothetical protein
MVSQSEVLVVGKAVGMLRERGAGRQSISSLLRSSGDLRSPHACAVFPSFFVSPLG